MACTPSNKCAKNLSKRTVLPQLIIKNVVTCFLEHSVDGRNLLTTVDIQSIVLLVPKLKKQELSYRKQIARQLRTQYVEGIYRSN